MSKWKTPWTVSLPVSGSTCFIRNNRLAVIGTLRELYARRAADCVNAIGDNEPDKLAGLIAVCQRMVDTDGGDALTFAEIKCALAAYKGQA